MRKLISLLIILFFVGCSIEPKPIYDFELNVGLEQDKNGYFHLTLNPQGVSNQTLHKLSVSSFFLTWIPRSTFPSAEFQCEKTA